jgi:hypothetical protein
MAIPAEFRHDADGASPVPVGAGAVISRPL